MRFCIGELGMALLALFGSLMGCHLALWIILPVLKLAPVFYWLWPMAFAFAMACFHPQPEKWHIDRHR